MSSAPAGAEYRALDGIRILLVEDTDDTRELLSFALEHCSALVTTASSAAEALEAFRRDRPQILVTDLAMPHHDGYWLLSEVRALAPAAAIPAVALTAFTERYSRDQVLAAGFDAFIPKPIDPTDLCRALRQVLRSSR